MTFNDRKPEGKTVWGRYFPGAFGNLRETITFTTAGTLLLIVLSLPAFKYFFFAENFTYLHIYRINDNKLIKAAFSRMVDKFFRPGFFFADIWWHFVLPPDPMLYHIRNLLFCIVDLLILHRVLLRLVQSRSARLIALFLFAASKIHLTVIGYINSYEISILLMFLLLTLLSWCRFLESRKTADYILTTLFCILATYSKENGFLIVVVLAATVLACKRDLRGQASYWVLRYVPFLVIALSYWVLRFILIGPFNKTNPLYAPMLSFRIARWQTKAFLATVGNFSLTDPNLIGARGLAGVLTGDSDLAEYLLCALLYLLISLTLWHARKDWRTLLVPVLWIVLYLSPIWLIRNHQVYYHQEPLVGVVLATGIALTRAGKRLLLIWFLVVAVVAINGFVSNRRSYYPWQFCADQAQVVKPIVESNRANPPDRIFLIASPERRVFWTYTVGYELIPHLMRSTKTEVEVIDSPDEEWARANSAVYRLD